MAHTAQKARSRSLRYQLTLIFRQLKRLTEELHTMASGYAVLTQDVSNLQVAVAALLQTQTGLIAALATEQQALATAIASENPADVAAASTNIEGIITQLQAATAAGQTAISGVQAPAPAAPTPAAPAAPVVADPAPTDPAPVDTGTTADPSAPAASTTEPTTGDAPASTDTTTNPSAPATSGDPTAPAATTEAAAA